MAGQIRRFSRIFVIATAQVVLVALILALLVANWMPAIYESDWFEETFRAAPENSETSEQR